MNLRNASIARPITILGGRIGHLYPKVKFTAEMAADRPDLRPYVGKKLTVISWLWARTVKSPNPAFADVDVPLTTTFMLSTKPGKEAYATEWSAQRLFAATIFSSGRHIFASAKASLHPAKSCSPVHIGDAVFGAIEAQFQYTRQRGEERVRKQAL